MRLRVSLALIALTVMALPVEGRAEGPAPAATTADLNMRGGPGTGHRVILTIPQGGRVTVNGCTVSFDWCDVAFAGSKGWVAGQYLIYGGNGRYQGQPIPVAGPHLGVPRSQRDYPVSAAAPVYKGGPVYKGDPVAAAPPPPVQAYDYDVELYPFARQPCPRYPDRYFEHQVC
ncbi:SH3 domain-containing protein [Roseibium sediminicola]|uniref:SH3 domain-containing protein n=1 Tax=Roseibium sediminicola TaxID=2933272 RepID=A0ABT0GSK7_9HYPH|nr:SH3 domain-containing protein [Roseibium sp. CAU 1639]MCK7612429.1 SH3 domain-containing protein [Roseibium sp. CAU 1639]